MVKLLQQPIDLRQGYARPVGNAALARVVDHFRSPALLGRHRIDDSQLPLEGFGVDRPGGGRGVGLHLRRQFVEQGGHAAHVLQLAELIAQVHQVERLALGDLLGELFGFFLINLALYLLNQGQHIAHAEDARGDAFRLKELQRLGLLARADKQNGLACHVADRQRRAATRIAVGFGQDDAGQAQGIVKGFGCVDGILARHAVNHEETLMRLDRRLEFAHFRHHFRIDMQSSGGVEQQHVVGLQRRLSQRALGDRHRCFARVGRREAGADLRGQGLELQNGRRTVHVGADHQHFFVLFFLQPPGEFARARSLARALQPGEHHHDGTLGAQVEAAARLAHETRQFLMHDLDEGLPRREALRHLHADRTRLDGVGETLDDRQRDIGVEQRETNLAHGFGYVVLGESAAAG